MNRSYLPRIVVCGAVDDGKSTLIGRLLAETGSVPLDELQSATLADGTQDFSLLTDGLESERDQGITIDVAFRYLALPGGARALLADSPGHEQYTRNMAVAASTADVALLVVDAVRGLRDQTRRHAMVCQLMGVKNFIVALNKMDLIPTSEAPARIESLTAEILQILALSENVRPAMGSDVGGARVVTVPVSGLRGDNVTVFNSDFGARSLAQVSLVEALTAATMTSTQTWLDDAEEGQNLRLPVQIVIRNDSERWYGGRVAAGSIRRGEDLVIWPSLEKVTVTLLMRAGELVDSARAKDSVSLLVERDVDLGRGDVLVRASALEHLPVSRAHLVDVVWLSEEALDADKSYLLRVGPQVVPVRCEVIRYQVNLDDMSQVSSSGLAMNDIGRVEITADRAFLLDPYVTSRDSGGFILCDRVTGDTVAAGMSVHHLRRESDVVRHSFSVTREQREVFNGVRGGVLWLTGLPGSGKSTVADALEQVLFERGIRCYILDGDMVRQTLSDDLGFSPEDRAENVRRVARTAQLMMDAGLVVIVSLVSPFAADREKARELFAASDFAEVFIDTPIELCRERDPKGLYAREASDPQGAMTGMGQAYERPISPEIHLDGASAVSENALTLARWVSERRIQQA
jgi:bifunctional enzyme CysN/CysC